MTGNRDDRVLLRPTTFGLNDLGEIRSLVHRSGAAAGLDDDGLLRFTTAVNEAVANAIRHGGPRHHVSMTMTEGWLRAEVTDDGGSQRIVVPAEAPGADQEHGRGLWIASRMSDRLAVVNTPEGTRVTLEMRLAGGSAER